MKLDVLSFQDTIDSSSPIFVKFEASWCGPCKAYAPVFKQFSEQNQDIKCYTVDCEEMRDIAIKYGIMSIPCTILFKDGKDINRKLGELSLQELKDLYECKL